MMNSINFTRFNVMSNSLIMTSPFTDLPINLHHHHRR